MKTNDKVKTILLNYPETRNSDTELYIRYLLKYGNLNFFEKKNVRSILEKNIKQSSIQRIRADLQNKKHLFLADDKVMIKRNKKSIEMNKFYTPETTIDYE